MAKLARKVKRQAKFASRLIGSLDAIRTTAKFSNEDLEGLKAEANRLRDDAEEAYVGASSAQRANDRIISAVSNLIGPEDVA